MISPIDPTSPTPALAPAAGAGAGITFHEVLSALNPLQYLPVLGPIYRAITGDLIPEPLRIAGSLAASALMGGPIGVLVTAVGTVVQKLTGLDADSLAHDALAGLGVIDDAPPAATACRAMAACAAYGGAAAAAARAASTMSSAGETVPSDAANRSLALAAYGRTLQEYGPAGSG